MNFIYSKFRIFLTNWVNILFIFLATYLSIIISDMIDKQEGFAYIPFSFFFSLYSILGYGFIFWLGFIIAMLLLDVLLIKNDENLLQMLLIEWFLVSLPFAYWSIKYYQWIFAVAISAFLIAQVIRRNKIIEVFNKNLL
jgi:hypothetical protein